MDEQYWKDLSSNELHEKLNYWVSIAWDWPNTPSHHAHVMVDTIRKEIQSRGIKVEVNSPNTRGT